MIALIEQNRRHSRATLRILRLKRDHIWPEAGMRYGVFVFSGSLSNGGGDSVVFDSQRAGQRSSGNLFVISAPSGAGKTSLCKEIIDFFPGLRHSVSYTTRLARTGELDGKDYHFVSREIFDRMVSEGAFAEWAEVHGNCYGTAIRTLDNAQAAGYDILLEIDCQGAAQIKKNYRQGVFVFILPPDFAELKRRLEGRGTDSTEIISRRIDNARGEIHESVWYDYLLINDDFSVALDQLKAIVMAEHCRTDRMLGSVAAEFGLSNKPTNS
jgi:guanylate kinase